MQPIWEADKEGYVQRGTGERDEGSQGLPLILRAVCWRVISKHLSCRVSIRRTQWGVVDGRRCSVSMQRRKQTADKTRRSTVSAEASSETKQRGSITLSFSTAGASNLTAMSVNLITMAILHTAREREHNLSLILSSPFILGSRTKWLVNGLLPLYLAE